MEVQLSVESQGACTHTGCLPESDPVPVVEFFTHTGITAAGGQFDFERCTRKMFVHRNRKLKPCRFSYRPRYLKQSSGTDRFRHVCKFHIETDKLAAGPACQVQVRHANLPDRQFGRTGCVSKHPFTLHPAPESDPAPVLPVCVCVQAPLLSKRWFTGYLLYDSITRKCPKIQ